MSSPDVIDTVPPNPRTPLRGFDWFRALGSPTMVCAPMVEASELAFRMLVRRYGAQLAYTPMLHAGQMLKARSYMSQNFTTCPGDRPLIAQFCGNDPEVLLNAAKMVQDRVDAVDLNLGCPQGIARKGHYGAFLLEDTELLVRIVSTLATGLRVPVTCKIRRLPDDESTIALVLALQGAGCSLITIHGRQRDNLKAEITAVDWDIIRRIKSHPAVTIPVVANGGVADVTDVRACLDYTGADAVMSSEALLENPALFSGRRVRSTILAREYLALASEHGADIGCAKGHLIKILFGVLCSPPFHDLRAAIAGQKRVLDDFAPLLEEVERRYEGLARGGGVHRSIGAPPPAAETTAATEAPAILAESSEPQPNYNAASAAASSGLVITAEAKPSSSPADAAQHRIDAWQSLRFRDPSIGLSHPAYLDDIALPGAWYMRHRKTFTYSDARSADVEVGEVPPEKEASGYEEDPAHGRKRPRLVPQEPGS